MSDDKERLLKLLTVLFDHTDVDNGTSMKALRMIDTQIDIDFINALNSWIETQNEAHKATGGKSFSAGKVISCLAYMIAAELALLSPDRICKFSAYYGDYIHQMAHSIAVGEASEKNK